MENLGLPEEEYSNNRTMLEKAVEAITIKNDVHIKICKHFLFNHLQSSLSQ